MYAFHVIRDYLGGKLAWTVHAISVSIEWWQLAWNSTASGPMELGPGLTFLVGRTLEFCAYVVPTRACAYRTNTDIWHQPCIKSTDRVPLPEACWQTACKWLLMISCDALLTDTTAMTISQEKHGPK